jgi:hypothetical protein
MCFLRLLGSDARLEQPITAGKFADELLNCMGMEQPKWSLLLSRLLSILALVTWCHPGPWM